MIPSTVLIRDDETYYRARISMIAISRLQKEWEDFRRIGKEAKEAISSAVLDSRQGRPSFIVRHLEEPFTEDRSARGDDDLEMESNTPASSRESRFLLPEARFVEESIKNHLVASPNAAGKRFLIDVKDRAVTVSAWPENMNGAGKTIAYSYTPTEGGGLGDAVTMLTTSIDRDFALSNLVQEAESASNGALHTISTNGSSN